MFNIWQCGLGLAPATSDSGNRLSFPFNCCRVAGHRGHSCAACKATRARNWRGEVFTEMPIPRRGNSGELVGAQSHAKRRHPELYQFIGDPLLSCLAKPACVQPRKLHVPRLPGLFVFERGSHARRSHKSYYERTHRNDALLAQPLKRRGFDDACGRSRQKGFFRAFEVAFSMRHV